MHARAKQSSTHTIKEIVPRFVSMMIEAMGPHPTVNERRARGMRRCVGLVLEACPKLKLARVILYMRTAEHRAHGVLVMYVGLAASRWWALLLSGWWGGVEGGRRWGWG
jgi:hypothetical protein